MASLGKNHRVSTLINLTKKSSMWNYITNNVRNKNRKKIDKWIAGLFGNDNNSGKSSHAMLHETHRRRINNEGNNKLILTRWIINRPKCNNNSGTAALIKINLINHNFNPHRFGCLAERCNATRGNIHNAGCVAKCAFVVQGWWTVTNVRGASSARNNYRDIQMGGGCFQGKQGEATK